MTSHENMGIKWVFTLTSFVIKLPLSKRLAENRIVYYWRHCKISNDCHCCQYYYFIINFSSLCLSFLLLY